jgi:hypothetical protein
MFEVVRSEVVLHFSPLDGSVLANHGGHFVAFIPRKVTGEFGRHVQVLSRKRGGRVQQYFPDFLLVRVIHSYNHENNMSLAE